MRTRTLVVLAVAVAVVPAAAQAGESAADGDPGPAAHPRPDAGALRASVLRLGSAARADAARLGLRPPAIPVAAATAQALARQESRLRHVVGFLSGRDELHLPVDERPEPPPSARGRTLAARVAHQHRLATRHALRVGLDRPAALQPAAGRGERIGQLARWRAVSAWLASRRERVRKDEQPLSARVPHFDAFTCIAEHESGGRWDISTGNGYYGGLQMDRQFQQTYAPGLYRAKGTADNWTQEEQIRAAAKAVTARGFSPWPNTARTCGVL